MVVDVPDVIMKVPSIQFIVRLCEYPVAPQRRALTVQTVQKIVEIPQVQSSGLVIDVSVIMPRQVQQFSGRRRVPRISSSTEFVACV